MTKYNVCKIAPPGYIHHQAFDELCEVIFNALTDLGHETSFKPNEVVIGKTNILIGCHLLSPEYIQQVAKNTIILNTEQISNNDSDWNETVLKWCSSFTTWDYSTRNLDKLRSLGVKNVKHLKIGYHHKLERIKKQNKEPIDILFYGSTGERRKLIIDQLQATGLNIKTIFGQYGKDRDIFISQSKVILNCHHYKSSIFEIVRAFYLMTNQKAIATEISPNTSIDPMYAMGVHSAPYEKLVSSCCELVSNHNLRKATEQAAYETIRNLPQTEFLKEIL